MNFNCLILAHTITILALIGMGPVVAPKAHRPASASVKGMENINVKTEFTPGSPKASSPVDAAAHANSLFKSPTGAAAHANSLSKLPSFHNGSGPNTPVDSPTASHAANAGDNGKHDSVPSSPTASSGNHFTAANGPVPKSNANGKRQSKKIKLDPKTAGEESHNGASVPAPSLASGKKLKKSKKSAKNKSSSSSSSNENMSSKSSSTESSKESMELVRPQKLIPSHTWVEDKANPNQSARNFGVHNAVKLDKLEFGHNKLSADHAQTKAELSGLSALYKEDRDNFAILNEARIANENKFKDAHTKLRGNVREEKKKRRALSKKHDGLQEAHTKLKGDIDIYKGQVAQTHTEIRQGLTDNENAISGVNTKVTDHGERIVKAETGLSDLKTKHGTLEGTVTGHGNTILEHSGHITKYGTSIEKLKTKDGELDTAIAGVKGTHDAFVVKYGEDQLATGTRFGGVEQSIADANTEAARLNEIQVGHGTRIQGVEGGLTAEIDLREQGDNALKTHIELETNKIKEDTKKMGETLKETDTRSVDNKRRISEHTGRIDEHDERLGLVEGTVEEHHEKLGKYGGKLKKQKVVIRNHAEQSKNMLANEEKLFKLEADINNNLLNGVISMVKELEKNERDQQTAHQAEAVKLVQLTHGLEKIGEDNLKLRTMQKGIITGQIAQILAQEKLAAEEKAAKRPNGVGENGMAAVEGVKAAAAMRKETRYYSQYQPKQEEILVEGEMMPPLMEK